MQKISALSSKICQTAAHWYWIIVDSFKNLNPFFFPSNYNMNFKSEAVCFFTK